MLAYIIKRLIWMGITLGIILVTAFILLKAAPGDPVLYRLGIGGSSEGQNAQNRILTADYIRLHQQMGLHLPLFYLSIEPWGQADTLYKIINKQEKIAAEALFYQTGNWELIQLWRTTLFTSKELRKTGEVNKLLKLTLVPELLVTLSQIRASFSLKKNAPTYLILNETSQLEKIAIRIAQSKPQLNFYIPKIIWFGNQNQFHLWLSGIFSGDWGYSYHDQQLVITKIKHSLKWTIILAISALSLTILIAIPLGIWQANQKNAKIKNAVNLFLLAIYATPSYWVATMAVIFLCGGDYLNLFPSHGVEDLMNTEHWHFYQRLRDWIWRSILPVFCLTFWNISFLARQIQVNLENILNAGYVTTAKAKGVGQYNINKDHAFRNILPVFFAAIGDMIPILLGGAVAIEMIFSYSGIGLLMFQSISFRDYPVTMGILLIGAIITLVSSFLVDILNKISDPRI